MPAIAYVNGVFSELEQAVVSINDRAVQFGDSVYEVVRCYGKNPFSLDQHLKRLRDGCDAVQIPLALLNDLPRIISEGLERSGFKLSLVYIQVTRGTQLRSLLPASDLTPTLIVTFREHTDPAALQESGVTVGTYPDLRWRRCDIKCTNLLPNVLAIQAVNKYKHFEAVLVDEAGMITEGASSTFFLVKGRKLISNTLSHSVLAGVNRQVIVEELCSKVGLSFEEHFLLKDLVATAEEAFIASTAYLILPVTGIDSNPVGNGKPGSVTKQLLAEYHKSIQGS